MSLINPIEQYIDKENNFYGSFLIEPLESGQGITLGNALRRTLLSDISGFAITGVRINNLTHEFASVEGIREDILEILLNLKEIIFQPCLKSSMTEYTSKKKAFLHIQGPCIVTAGLFFLPKNLLKIINPNQYICTIVNDSELYLELDIEKGFGYQLIEQKEKKSIADEIDQNKPITLRIDSTFVPIRNVNYKIKLIHDSKGHIKESLILEIITNGSITPKRSLQEAIKIIFDLFYPLLLDNTFLSFSKELINFSNHENLTLNKPNNKE